METTTALERHELRKWRAHRWRGNGAGRCGNHGGRGAVFAKRDLGVRARWFRRRAARDGRRRRSLRRRASMDDGERVKREKREDANDYSGVRRTAELTYWPATRRREREGDSSIRHLRATRETRRGGDAQDAGGEGAETRTATRSGFTSQPVSEGTTRQRPHSPPEREGNGLHK